MALNWKVLSTVVRIPPQAWDAIIPKGPVRGAYATRVDAAARRFDSVALNPQPLPPLEAEVGAQLLQSLTYGAIIVVGGRGENGAARLLEDIDDWCGTGWPRKWPRPRPPKGWDDGQVFAGAGLAAAALADQYDHDPEMQEALGAAAERLLDRAVQG